MSTLILISLLISSIVAQPVANTPFNRLATSIGGLSSTQVITPQTQFTSPYAPDVLSGSSLTYPQGLNSQLNMPNVNLQGLSPATFSDPFSTPASPSTSNINNMVPSNLGPAINSMTSPFTSQTSPVPNTLSNLFGPATTTTTQSSNSPFFNAAPAINNNIWPIDSSQTLFPSSFNSPATTQFQTPQAPAQLSTFSQQAPTIVRNQPQAPVQPSFPSQPQAPSSPFTQQAPTFTQQAPVFTQQAPAQLSNFDPSAINGPSLPISPDFNTQAAPPALSNNSPFAAQSPRLPAAPSSPVFPTAPQQQQPTFPQQQQQPNFPSGPVFLESGSSSSPKPSATAVIRSTAPVVSSSPSLSFSPPFPALSSLTRTP